MKSKNEGGVGWTIYIRMELLKNLNQYRTEHPLSVDDIVHLGIDMCSALEYCGKKNIVHRDIKPDNIFVNEFGDFKLGDFGIARHLEMTAANLSQKGTSAYMAPEIYRGDPYNASVDIYSLGIVLYRLLNRGRLPFMPPYPKPISYEDTENALSRRLAGEPLPEPADGGKVLADIIRRAGSADTKFRYTNPTDMKNDLYRWQVSGQHTQAASAETGTIPVLPSGGIGPMNSNRTTTDFNRPSCSREPTSEMFGQNGSQTQRNIWGPGSAGSFQPEAQAASSPKIRADLFREAQEITGRERPGAPEHREVWEHPEAPEHREVWEHPEAPEHREVWVCPEAPEHPGAWAFPGAHREAAAQMAAMAMAAQVPPVQEPVAAIKNQKCFRSF